MKRTHTEQVEYFEHGGDRYRRFADGSWQVKVSNGWSERFCDAKQLEAIYQQPQRCKSCKFYDENPHLHCAVHPMGPEGVCGDWEQRAVKERPAENDHYRQLVEQRNDAFRDLHAVLSRPLRAPVGHDYFLDDLQCLPSNLSTWDRFDSLLHAASQRAEEQEATREPRNTATSSSEITHRRIPAERMPQIGEQQIVVDWNNIDSLTRLFDLQVFLTTGDIIGVDIAPHSSESSQRGQSVMQSVVVVRHNTVIWSNMTILSPLPKRRGFPCGRPCQH